MRRRTLKTLPPRNGKIYITIGDAPGMFFVDCDFTMTEWPKESMRHIMDSKRMSAERIMEITGVDVLVQP